MRIQEAVLLYKCALLNEQLDVYIFGVKPKDV